MQTQTQNKRRAAESRVSTRHAARSEPDVQVSHENNERSLILQNALIRCKVDLVQDGFSLVNDIEESEVETFATQLGPLQDQYGTGKKVFRIKPDPSKEHLYGSQTRKPLYPHSEAYEYPLPPRLIALWCKRPDKNGEGFTEVADAYEFIKELNADELTALMTRRYTFKPNSSLKNDGFSVNCHKPIIDMDTVPDTVLFRYSYNNMLYCRETDTFTREILERVLDFFEEKKTSLLLKSKQFLVIDNYRCLHSRTHFSDMERELIRFFMV